MRPRLGVVGGLALDNVIMATGERYVGRPSGNSLWASLGGSLFGSRFGIVARAGTDFPTGVLDRVAASGVDVSGVASTGEPHAIRIAYLHTSDGRRLQPVPERVLAGLPEAERAAFTDSTISAGGRRGADPSFDDIPLSWRTSVAGWHIPLVSLAAHRELARGLSGLRGPVVIADCPNRHEITDLETDMAPTLPLLDVFLPSTSDLEIFDPRADPVRTARRLSSLGDTEIVLKRGADGVQVFRSGSKGVVVPSLAVDVVDPTGAGDAFCGAFLAAYVETRDAVHAAMYGAVAASFAVESVDPLDLCRISVHERDARLSRVVSSLASA
ncbi:carbohydrate kinase family protein [Dactylosporangium roseum]|uniref:Carbohydrate kinase family protein n=1 Tax=Dactylosporangium roseum TaxID=47989 RepID=A0ABY5Z1A5_9ACTN|nr:carbohydrate kinase family protein [Dactylosporangium roseum]UWZ34563.1 carbohydrate kinase family protein [Dactylosporangium roseum]